MRHRALIVTVLLASLLLAGCSSSPERSDEGSGAGQDREAAGPAVTPLPDENGTAEPEPAANESGPSPPPPAPPPPPRERLTAPDLVVNVTNEDSGDLVMHLEVKAPSGKILLAETWAIEGNSTSTFRVTMELHGVHEATLRPVTPPAFTGSAFVDPDDCLDLDEFLVQFAVTLTSIEVQGNSCPASGL